MQHYEIRVLREDGTTALMVAALQPNDNEAMRSARKIAGSRKFEVWRGADCIYGAEGAEVIGLPSANRSGT
jgi:hypothetical protein